MSKNYIYSPIIYKTTNLINGKIYVGQHYTSADDGYLGSGIYFKSVIKEFGRKNFIREILEFCEKKNLNKQEKYWISELSANNPKIGYNKTVGGQFGWFGIENPMYGVHCSGMFGKKHSIETKQKISLSLSGKIQSEKTRQKRSQSLIGTRNGEDHPRNKYSYILSNGKNYWDYFSIKERKYIILKFIRKQSNKIKYKNIIIIRVNNYV